MGGPAARIGDMHMCPMVTPGLPPIPHVGGPITGPGCPTVLIGGMPASVMGDMCVCVGPPDTIVLGSVGVLIGGKPAARMGDQCAHGGAIILGCPTVLIGEVSPGPPVMVTPAEPSGGSSDGSSDESSGPDSANNGLKTDPISNTFQKTASVMTAPFATKLSRIQGLMRGAQDGEKTIHKHNDNQCKVQYQIHGASNEPVQDQQYEIKTTDGNIFNGKTDSDGMTKQITGYMEGDCTLSFPD